MDGRKTVVEEHSKQQRRCDVSHAGAFRRDDVGMSNDNVSEKLTRRKSEVSSVKIIF